MDFPERIIDLPFDLQTAESLVLATANQKHFLTREGIVHPINFAEIESRLGVVPLGAKLPVHIEKPHTILHTSVILLMDDQQTGRILLGEMARSWPENKLVGLFETHRVKLVFEGLIPSIGLSPLTAAINGSEQGGSLRTHLL